MASILEDTHLSGFDKAPRIKIGGEGVNQVVAMNVINEVSCTWPRQRPTYTVIDLTDQQELILKRSRRLLSCAHAMTRTSNLGLWDPSKRMNEWTDTSH